MQLDQNPVFRRVIAPWYDSDTACLAVIVLMSGVLLFGIAGITVAGAEPVYRSHLWVPSVLVLLSGGVILSTAVRLIRRYSRP